MRQHRWTGWLAVVVLGASGAAIGSGGVAGAVARADAAGTVWLCRPGIVGNPCTISLTSTVVPASGARTVEETAAATNSPFDCFYVYPTVSAQSTANANLVVQSTEIGAAASQAAPFSSVCRVWAPMYRQRTVASLATGPDPTADTVAYRSLLAGWEDYLAHFNDGRPVIFIGHSQGAAMLIRLLASQIDTNAALRSRMVSAIIAGGNVAVPTGRTVGSTFRNIALCTRPSALRCVIAYSTFPGQPPATSFFGRPGQGVSLQSNQAATAGVQVACVNPAALAGGTGALEPWFLAVTSTAPPPPVTTPWVSYPGLYTARCKSAGGATWLQVNDVGPSGDTRPVVTEALGPNWGYHLDDINLATGNLVADVRTEEAAYTASHH